MGSVAHNMETYFGVVRSPADAIKLFEACRQGMLPRVQRRLSEKERQHIRPGSVYVWDEREAGMRRWTDGKSWSASRVSGSFLTYREMEGKRSSGFSSSVNQARRNPNQQRGGDQSEVKDEQRDSQVAAQSPTEPEGYRYKPDGLMKQSFSITTQTGEHLHLISYYTRPNTADLMTPTANPALHNVVPPKGLYPDTTWCDSSSSSNANSNPANNMAKAVNAGGSMVPHYMQQVQSPGGNVQRSVVGPQTQQAQYSQQYQSQYQPYPQYGAAQYGNASYPQQQQQQPQQYSSYPPSPVTTPPYASNQYSNMHSPQNYYAPSQHQVMPQTMAPPPHPHGSAPAPPQIQTHVQAVAPTYANYSAAAGGPLTPTSAISTPGGHMYAQQAMQQQQQQPTSAGSDTSSRPEYSPHMDNPTPTSATPRPSTTLAPLSNGVQTSMNNKPPSMQSSGNTQDNLQLSLLNRKFRV